MASPLNQHPVQTLLSHRPHVACQRDGTGSCHELGATWSGQRAWWSCLVVSTVVGFWRRGQDSPSMTSSWAVQTSRSTADWASSGSAIMASHSSGVRLEVTMVAARWWRRSTASSCGQQADDHDLRRPHVQGLRSGTGGGYRNQARPRRADGPILIRSRLMTPHFDRPVPVRRIVRTRLRRIRSAACAARATRRLAAERLWPHGLPIPGALLLLRGCCIAAFVSGVSPVGCGVPRSAAARGRGSCSAGRGVPPGL